MSETEPVRRLTRLSKAKPSILAAAGVLARMIVDASSIARGRCHPFGKPARFVAHNGLIGPTRPGWSLGSLLTALVFTSRPTRLNCS